MPLSPFCTAKVRNFFDITKCFIAFNQVVTT
nr:MAG TPA: hypothetical protein [Caudoviricetes sp.]